MRPTTDFLSLNTSPDLDLEPEQERENPEQWMEGQLIANLMATAMGTQLSLLFIIPAMFTLLYGNVWMPGLYAWLAAVLSITGFRLYVIQMHRQTLANAPPAGQLAFMRRYGVTWPLSALAWASSVWLHYGKAPEFVQFVCWVVVIVFGALASSGFAAHRPTMRAYINAFCATMIAGMLWQIGWTESFHARSVEYVTVFLMIMYWFALLNIGSRQHNTMRAGVRLQKANADLIRSLTEQTRTALDAVQTKNRFIASAAHDLRQPVHALGLYAGWLRDEPELVAELTPKILQSTQAVNELFDALFDLVRLDSGKFKPDWQEVALDELVRDLLVQYAAQAEGKGIALRLRARPVRVWTDPIMLRRILGNLLSNAVKHTNQGGVLLAIRPGIQSVRVEVWDTGIGIEPEYQQIIFREFYRVQKHQGTEEGFGLGLSIVSRLAIALGHPLALQSRVGRGTVFRLTLPLAAPA